MRSLGLLLLLLLATVRAQIHFPGEEPEDTAAAPEGDVGPADKKVFDALVNVNTRQNFNTFGSSSCTLPGGRTGRCQSFSSCRDYFPLRNLLRHQAVLFFLSQRICRRFRNTVHLCCPSPPPGTQPARPPPGRPSNPSSPLSQVECGRVSLRNRVVEGEETEPGEWPWLAALGILQGSAFRTGCGGTLITRQHVLTAGHCFANPLAVPNKVRLGEYNLVRTDDTPTQDFDIKNLIDRGYNSVTQENDIAIVVLDREARLNEFVQPACLPYNIDNSRLSERPLIVTGWGRTSHSNLRTPDIPLKALVPIRDRDSCAMSYIENPVKIDERVLCAGNGTTDACDGDSGGPLHYLDLDTGKYHVVGIVSFGVGCAMREFPGVYTNVNAFLDWIENNVK